MTDITEAELIRRRWRRALEREGLETVDREDFALGGLASRLRTPSVRLLVLPADPEADIVAINDGLWAWMKNYQGVDLGGRNLRLGTLEMPKAHAAALVDSYGNYEAWNSYVAIHRSGAVECGLGNRGAWERTDNDDNPVRVFQLISIVARTWAMLKFAGAFRDRVAPPAPWQLTIALHRTGGALLGNLGEGWAPPTSIENNVAGCPETHVLWHIEFSEWPDDVEAQRLAFSVGDRVEDAWGVRQRRYLANRGPMAGKLDIRQLHE